MTSWLNDIWLTGYSCVRSVVSQGRVDEDHAVSHCRSAKGASSGDLKEDGSENERLKSFRKTGAFSLNFVKNACLYFSYSDHHSTFNV